MTRSFLLMMDRHASGGELGEEEEQRARGGGAGGGEGTGGGGARGDREEEDQQEEGEDQQEVAQAMLTVGWQPAASPPRAVLTPLGVVSGGHGPRPALH